MIPVQILSYYATGEIFFSYLRTKGSLRGVSQWSMARTSLELNFVNHIMPVGGVAGLTFLSWELNRHGVSPGKTASSFLIKHILQFASFVVLLVAAAIILIIDHHVHRNILLVCALLAVVTVGGTLFMMWLVSNRHNLVRFSDRLTNFVNRVVRFVTRGRKTEVLKQSVIENYLLEIHEDYLEIRRNSRVLLKPFMWATIANILDVLLLFIAFWALGDVINIAAVFIAFGLASIGGVIASTPGGAGAYEVIMVAFLSAAGVKPDVAIAGTLLDRVILVLGTILFGYFFYQMTISKYGKPGLREATRSTDHR